MPENRLSNFAKDLGKAKKQALFIEILQSDLDSWADQSADVFWTVCDTITAIFDSDVKVCRTNVLIVDNEDREFTSIFGSLLNSLDSEFDDLHKREILNRLTGFGLSQALGGGIGDAVGNALNVGTEKMMDYLAEWTGSASDYLTSFTEMASEKVAEQSGDLVAFVGEASVESITGKFSSNNGIYLSHFARKRFRDLAPRLSEQATSHETLQLALEMLLVTAQGAAKVIVVKDPLRLDDASLALLAMLVSLEKDLRQVSHTEDLGHCRAQTAGISVVLVFTGLQPHDTVKNKDAVEKQRAISRLRMMASRYSLLERLDSDIPVPAVRASTFVGRETELKSLWHDWIAFGEKMDRAAPQQAWALIRGEPGTGKTALANCFIQQIRSDVSNPACVSIPILRMLNQTGHSARATGLASLKNSIVDELRRLNLIYEEKVGWFDRFGRKVKEGTQAIANDVRSEDPEAKKRVRARLGKVISRLVGVDAAIEVARSTKAWSEQDEMRSLREEEFGQSFQANRKEDQYKLLREALREIRTLARKCTPHIEGQLAQNTTPLLLLIDDLQWVDDLTAEFLLNEWPADLPVYIIVTARGSDCLTAAMDSKLPLASNRCRNQLFAELGLIEAVPVTPEPEKQEESGREGVVQQKASISLVSRLDLKGMDRPMLANLIKLTYTGITREQADHFAAGVIRNLAGKNGDSDVITLFAIETLNVISDSLFFWRNPELPRLIESTGNDSYRFRAPENTGLVEALDTVFKKLTETYQASYLLEARQGVGGARFNLASYAVLEERLHIIEQHFGEYGGTARYSLLFSALIGSPFQSGLVRRVLEDLQQMSPEEHLDLSSFLSGLQAEAHGCLDSTQYELLERSYEIIRRLEENTSRYIHQHSLLQHFLLGQFTRVVDKAWQSTEALENGIRELVERIAASGNVWFAEQIAENTFGVREEDALEVERRKCLATLTGYWHRLMCKRTSKLGKWAHQYTTSLNSLAMAHSRLGLAAEALPLNEQALSIRREGYESNPERWAEAYAVSLLNLAATHVDLGRPEEAVPLYKQALSIRREGYESNPERWAEGYANCLNNLAVTQLKLGDAADALPLHEQALLIRREGYESNPERWAEDYATSLGNLACTHDKLGDTAKALPLHEQALSILREGYESNPERWAEDYATSLGNLAVTHQNLGRAAEALLLSEQALSIRREGYESNPERWVENYLKNLLNLAGTRYKLGNTAEALSLYERALSICREGYESNPERWAEDYAKSLRGVAVTHYKLGHTAETLLLSEQALSICREGYESNPERWAEDYATDLNNLAATHYKLGDAAEALSLSEQALSVRREGYESNPERWAEDYATSLDNLAMAYSRLGRAAEALPLHEQALSIRREGYESNPERWAEVYATSLGNLAGTHANLGHSADTMLLSEQALSICREGYESNPERWAERYAHSLNNLAVTHSKLGHLEEAVPLYKQALSIRREGYASNPERWAEDFANGLTSLAATHYTAGQTAEVLPLLEQALSIYREGYELNPERWAEAYARSLRGLAMTYNKLGRSAEALSLHEQALSIYREG